MVGPILCCTMKRIIDSLSKKFDLRLPTTESEVLDLTDDVQLAKIKTQEMNAHAMSLLAMTLDSECKIS